MSKLITSGIQRKYLRFTIIILLISLILSTVSIWVYLRGRMSRTVAEKYGYITEEMGISLDSLYQKSSEATSECILNDNVQKSLESAPLSAENMGALGKYFAYMDLDGVEDYCYVDNKKNVYVRSYSKVAYDDFIKSGFGDMLGDEYSKTKWIWTEDTLFGTGQKSLFIGRYIRNMEYAHEPGMLFLKMNNRFISQLRGRTKNDDEEAITGIMDKSGQICEIWPMKNYEMNEDTINAIKEFLSWNEYGVTMKNEKVPGGIVSVYKEAAGELMVFTFVPDRVLNASFNQLLFVTLGIFLFVVLIAVALSIFLSKRFTQPIKDITKAMAGFDGQDFSRVTVQRTNTELDQIGSCYNKMLDNIEKLFNEVKEQQKELRKSELNMLISQINPHFIYNTLDTIYMLARINKEETTMRMIQALSKYLRLSLSKGSDIVTLEDELENVKSYMEIQQIRNDTLFTYEVDCGVNPKEVYVLKLILQPIVENAIKYGFESIFEGGVIKIKIEEDNYHHVLTVSNNGTVMDGYKKELLNNLNYVPVPDMKNYFPDKKHGYGVVNIITRLRLKYGDGVRFYYEVSDEWTHCIVRIPKGGEGLEAE